MRIYVGVAIGALLISCKDDPATTGGGGGGGGAGAGGEGGELQGAGGRGGSGPGGASPGGGGQGGSGGAECIPATETCDGADQDCDGVADNGLNLGTPCTDGMGECGADGELVCDDEGGVVCSAEAGEPEAEVCDDLDNDCNGIEDDGFEVGEPCMAGQGECEATGAIACTLEGTAECDAVEGLPMPEVLDGLDNDCDGVPDQTFVDDDGDGATEEEGDCDDAVFAVGPRSVELQANGLDDDCDEAIDEVPPPCDGGTLDPNVPADFARAIGLCNAELVSAEFVGFQGTNGPAGRAIVTGFGSASGALNRPIEGNKMILLSSGRASTASHDAGTPFDNVAAGACISTAHPAPQGDPGACGAADPATVCDYAELRLTIRVPNNAQSLGFQYQFWSSEYPSFRCTPYDDTFLTLVTSQTFTGNIALSNNNRVVSVNGGLDICIDDQAGAPRDTNGDGIINGGEVVPTTNDCSIELGGALAATGFLFDNDATNNGTPDFAGSRSIGAGATTTLGSSAPVVPGETIVLRFIIFDEGDDIIDSLVAIDNWTWQ